jgi:hypothetical protein
MTDSMTMAMTMLNERHGSEKKKGRWFLPQHNRVVSPFRCLRHDHLEFDF